VAIAGSTWGGSMLKQRFVGRGMHLEFCHPEYPTPIVTSPIQEIREPQGVRSEINALA
jgi:NAD-dependent oxidoreductase involved in siderophore biosynthesis